MGAQRLPIPFIIASMVSGAIHPLISLVDTYFAAHLSTQDLACLALGGGVAGSIAWISGQLIGGFPGVLGRLRGRGDDAQVRRLNGEVLCLAWVLGLLLVVPAGFFFGEALIWITQSEATGSGARHYLQVRLLGLPFEVCLFVAFGILRAGYQAVWTPLLVMLAALGSNTALNALFIWGFDWGLTGLALASALAPMIAFAIAAVPIHRWQAWALGAGQRAVRNLELGTLTKVSVQLGSMALWRGLLLNGVLIGSAVVAEHLSTSDLAAHGLALQIWLLIAFLIDGFAHAGLAFGSQLLGAGALAQARLFSWRLLTASFGLSALICCALVMTWNQLPSFFGLDAAASTAFLALLIPMCTQVLPASLAFVGDGILKGAGDLAFLARQMAFASVLIFPLALLFLGKDLLGLWWAVTSWVTARALLSLLRLAGTRWQEIAQQQLDDNDPDHHVTPGKPD